MTALLRKLLIGPLGIHDGATQDDVPAARMDRLVAQMPP